MPGGNMRYVSTTDRCVFTASLDGKLFAARTDAGTMAVFSPDGAPLPEIPLLKKGPTNLAFGGPDGTTVFVTQSDGTFIEAFLVDRPGREFCMLRSNGSC